MSSEKKPGTLLVKSGYRHRGQNPLVQFEDALWSRNVPILLWRHTARNTTEQSINDLRMYLLMDYDIGGPKSYKDDLGKYDPTTGQLTVWDDSDLFVQLVSRPSPDLWDLSTPVKMKVDEARRDLKGNLEIGPRDIVVGLQWNLGDIQPGKSASVDVAMASAIGLGEVSGLTRDVWDLFDKKIR
ncbi:MAG: hypothetical protein P1Q69_05765 [Candidatus Thorarchaeota archaeon]|nr:hypothetical protein [Candidatus Thorarchaeota archaeon]